MKTICLANFAGVDHFMMTNKTETVHELHAFKGVKFILSSMVGRHPSSLLYSTLPPKVLRVPNQYRT